MKLAERIARFAIRELACSQYESPSERPSTVKRLTEEIDAILREPKGKDAK